MYASYHIAKRYNIKHKDLPLKHSDVVYLKLEEEYKVWGIPKVKLGNQCVGPFRVLQRIGRLTYKLNLPSDWLIHPGLQTRRANRELLILGLGLEN
jgi:hypothetical protein